uniref:BTB domain-containing protein n=1 Tax=Ditylenchus dipsaci TaxID=166011 RepID=A0A915EHK6_9BILA
MGKPPASFLKQRNDALRYLDQFLSSLSSYFKTFFFGKNQEEVRLKDECAAEFLHLLKAIYLSVDLKAGSEDVIRNNVECLLRLARCYQVEIVTKRCEMYLEKCPISEVTLEDKVLYAQDYRLLELLEQCVKKFKTVDDVKKLRQSSQYSRLTKENQILIFEILPE